MDLFQIITHGDTQIMVGNPKKAMEFYSTALAMDDNCFEAWLGMGLAYNTLYNYRKALLCYERALSLNQHSITAESMVEYLRYMVINYREH